MPEKIINLKEGDTEKYYKVLNIFESTSLKDKYLKFVFDLYPETNNIPKTMVYLKNDKIVGGLIRNFFDINNEMVIKYVGVLPESQNLGIGKKLIGELEKLAKNCECSGVSLETTSDVVGYYENLGYNITKRTKYLDSVESIYMGKRFK